jgi:hypothetical protein
LPKVVLAGGFSCIFSNIDNIGKENLQSLFVLGGYMQKLNIYEKEAATLG